MCRFGLLLALEGQPARCPALSISVSLTPALLRALERLAVESTGSLPTKLPSTAIRLTANLLHSRASAKVGNRDFLLKNQFRDQIPF
jgi:hypothetical protein